MNRRRLLQAAAATAILPTTWPRIVGSALAQGGAADAPTSRVRPGRPGWPSDAGWDDLARQVEGHLVKLRSPLDTCKDAPVGNACSEVFRELKNPYYIGDDVALTQTTGWVDAWTAAPSAYAVAARGTEDVVAAVNFARDNNLRLVVKGGGHSYLGTSNAPDSLLIWTRAMNAITLHDAFIAKGCEGSAAGVPAVSLGAGAIWMHSYDKVTTRGGRYVQGGGCGTVGVAGLVQGGGFGSYSKAYGIAAASLLEAEIVTADGAVRIANGCTNPDLFFALKGGGGGTFGVVTRLTLRTHELPQSFGIVAATIHAFSGTAYRRLISRFVAFYGDTLLNPHWGEIVTLRPGNRMDIRMAFQGLDEKEAQALWQPFWHSLAETPEDFTFLQSPLIRSAPARHRWDPEFLRANAPTSILSDDRPGAPKENIFWGANLSEAGHFLYGFESAWLPASLLEPGRRDTLIDALASASRQWSVELHFQKGLAGAPPEVIAAARETATNPAVIDAFALAIIAGEGPPAYPGLASHAPDMAAARRNAAEIAKAMLELKKAAPDAGAYVAESSFFEADWQRAYWGNNYPRLLEIKKRYDPSGLFVVHHGVGSEDWSADGFTRLAAR